MTTQTNYPIIRPTLELDFANSQELDPRITFTRSSPAVYYDGKTSVMAEQNLLTYSQTFNNAVWPLARVTLASSTYTAPDGTSTAGTIQATTVNGTHYISQVISTLSGTTTISFYLQAGTNNYVQVFHNGDANAFANFDLTAGAGVVGTTGTKTTATITAVGTWYRCVATFNSTTTYATTYGVSIIPASTSVYGVSWTPLGTETINIWGAQLEQRANVTSYNATTSTALTNYIPVLLSAANNTPRFDHNPNTGQSLGLLVEQQSTNLLTYSSDYTNAAWSKNGVSAITAASVAPDGTQTAQFLQETTANTSWHFWSQSSGVITTSTAYTLSAYFKNNGTQYAYLQFAMGGTTAQVVMDTTTGLITYNTGSSGTVTSVGNGWYKLSITSTTSSNTGGIVYVGISRTSPTVTQYTGDGYRGMYVWGAQLEALPFSTSYIPTVATTMTRNVDSAIITGTNFSSWYNFGQGTIFAHASTNSVVSASQNSALVGIGTDFVNYIRFFRAASQTVAALQIGTSGTNLFTLATGPWPDGGSSVKVAGSYITNNFSLCCNGTLTNFYSGNIPTVQTTLNIGNYPGLNTLNGCIKKISYYPYALSNAQLQALTTS